MSIDVASLQGLSAKERKYYENLLRQAYSPIHKGVVIADALRLRATDLGVALGRLPQKEVDRIETLENYLRGNAKLVEDEQSNEAKRLLWDLSNLKSKIERTSEDYYLTLDFAKLVYATERALRRAKALDLKKPEVESAQLAIKALRLKGYFWNPRGHSKCLHHESCPDLYSVCGKLPGHIFTSGFESSRRRH